MSCSREHGDVKDHLCYQQDAGDLAFGVQQGLLSQRFRANLRDIGVDPKSAESGVEITYADKLTSRLTVQPDLQWVRLADAPRDADSRWIATLRVRVELGSQP